LSKRARVSSPLLKQRTRQHVIADLAANHVERVILECGHTVERTRHDYGIDMLVRTYGQHGFVEPGYLLVQVKATERLRRVAGGRQISVRLETAHLAAWIEESAPVILIIHDVKSNTAYWLYVQQDVGHARLAPKWWRAKYATVRIPVSRVFNHNAVQELSALKRAVVGHILTAGDHHA
jgi:hypothetical protein